MHKIKSTYKVLADKAMQKDSIEEWIDWALEMMEAGFETEHLIILAGVSPHLNRFELDDILNRALKECLRRSYKRRNDSWLHLLLS